MIKYINRAIYIYILLMCGLYFMNRMYVNIQKYQNISNWFHLIIDVFVLATLENCISTPGSNN